MKDALKLAKKWNNSPTAYNQVQFLGAFNALSETDQAEAVKEGSALSRILLGWCCATRIEIKSGIFSC